MPDLGWAVLGLISLLIGLRVAFGIVTGEGR
jgi:hypothetical protein